MLTVCLRKPCLSMLLAYLRASLRSLKPSTCVYSQSTTSAPGQPHVSPARPARPAPARPADHSPMTALAMVILSHIRSRISRPESGSCMTRTTAPMSLFTVSGPSSSSARHGPSSAGSRRVGGSGRTPLPAAASQRPGGCGPPTAQRTPHRPEPTGDVARPSPPPPAGRVLPVAGEQTGCMHTPASPYARHSPPREGPRGLAGLLRAPPPPRRKGAGEGRTRVGTGPARAGLAAARRPGLLALGVTTPGSASAP